MNGEELQNHMEKRDGTIALLQMAADSNPQLRIGQILHIAASKAGWQAEDLFYIPDEILKKGLQKFLYI